MAPNVRSRPVNITTPQHCRRVFDALVGRRSGVVREVRLIDTIDGDARLYHGAATIANAHPGWDADIRMACGGSGPRREDAIMATLCEGLERYLASSYDRRRTGGSPAAPGRCRNPAR